MSQPTTDPLEPDPATPQESGASGPGTASGQDALEPVRAAEDEVIAELEESLQESGQHDLFPYQAVVLSTPGGADPVVEHDRALVEALRTELDRRGLAVPVLLGHRTREPLLTDTLRQAQEEGMTQLLAITTGAYASYPTCRQDREDIADALDTLLAEGRTLHVDKVRQYWNHPGFAGTYARIVTEGARQVLDGGGPPHLVFVTRSLPSALDDTSGPGDDEGNLYSTQHRQLSAAIAAEASATLGTTLEWDLTYSSRPDTVDQPWLGPDVDDHLRELAARGTEHVVLAPVGFVSDQSEVVDDLDTGAARTAEELGMQLLRLPTVGVDTEFVMGLVDLALERAAEARGEDVEQPTWPGSDPRPSTCLPGCCPNLSQARPAACGAD